MPSECDHAIETIVTIGKDKPVSVLNSSSVAAIPALVSSPEVAIAEKKNLFTLLSTLVRQEVARVGSSGDSLIMQAIDAARRVVKQTEGVEDDDATDLEDAASRFLRTAKRMNWISKEEEDNSSEEDEKISEKLRQELYKVQEKLKKITKEKDELEAQLNTPGGKERVLILEKSRAIEERNKAIQEKENLLRENEELKKKNKKYEEQLEAYKDIPKEFKPSIVTNFEELQQTVEGKNVNFNFEDNNDIVLDVGPKHGGWFSCLLGGSFSDV